MMNYNLNERDLREVIGGIKLEMSGPTLQTENIGQPTQSELERRKKAMSQMLSTLKRPIGC